MIDRVPPRLSASDTAYWLIQAKKGPNKDIAVNKLIEGHIGLAGAIAARYAARVPDKGDEIMAFALYMLVDSTNRISTGDLMTHHDNYDAYISVVLSREIARFLNQDYTVRPPTNDPKVLEDEIRRDPEAFKDKYTPRPLLSRHAVSPAFDQSYEFVVNDLIVRSDCFASRDREIIFKWLEGYSDAEIASCFHVSPQAISGTRKRLRDKIQRLTGDYKP